MTLIERLQTASSLAQALPACKEAADRIERLEASLAEWKALAIQWAKDNDQPARQENDDVYPGFRGNNEA